MKRKPICKEETQALAEMGACPAEQTPACCLTCGWYRCYVPALGREKECALFGSVAGVKWDKCGAWRPRS